jgi:hypothetical protein
MDYVRRLTDEAMRPEGHGHVSPYIRRLTDEAIGPRSRPQQSRGPYMRWLTDKFNSYTRQLNDEFN